jgi:hypothetical protein
LVLPVVDGPTHPYIASTAACWRLYGDVLAREFEHPELFAFHQLTVDAYAVQHPGRPERRSIQSVAVHLMTLALWLDRGADPRAGSALHKRVVSRPEYVWLEPPQPNGTLTVADVHRAATREQHTNAVWAWARDVWQAWEVHHLTVNGWIDRALGGANSA